MISHSSVDSEQLATTNIINSNLPQSKYNLNFALLNARSIGGHIDELRYILENTNLDFFGVTETFLRPSLPAAAYRVNGYKIFRNDRSGSIGGGVAVYVKNGLKSKLVSKSLLGKLEYLFVELFLCGSKFLLE